MTITNGLLTAAEYATYTGAQQPADPVRQAQWDDAITVASRWVERYCGRQFHTTASSVRYFDTVDGVLVRIDDASAVSAVAVDSDDDGQYATTVTQYQLLPHGARDPLLGSVAYTTIKALTLDLWPTDNSRQGAVKVTATWGWPSIPDDVKRACAVLAQDLLRDAQTSFGGLAVSAEGIVLGSRVPARVLGLLGAYRRMERVAGIA